MPRQIAGDIEAPRRRRGANVAAIEAENEHGPVMRVLLHSPKDVVAAALAFAVVSAIIANALFLQAGHHPAPMFGSMVAIPAIPAAPVSPLPRPRPIELTIKSTETPSEPKPVESKAADPLANLVKATTAAPVAPSTVVRPPAPIPVGTANTVGSRKVAAVQRTLTEYGYGQLKATGTVGADTQAAIQKFERERKMPVTGQMSDRLVRELTAMTGKPID